MNSTFLFFRWIVALSLASTLGLLFIVIFGFLIPMEIQYIIFGVDAVKKTPGHGSAILFLTMPFSAIAAAVGVICLTMDFAYTLGKLQVLTRRSSPTPAGAGAA